MVALHQGTSPVATVVSGSGWTTGVPGAMVGAAGGIGAVCGIGGGGGGGAAGVSWAMAGIAKARSPTKHTRLWDAQMPKGFHRRAPVTTKKDRSPIQAQAAASV